MSEFVNHPKPVLSDRHWKLPLILTLAVHLLVFILLIAPPSFLAPHLNLQEIQTITLFTPEEVKPTVPHRPRSKARRPTKKTPPPPKKTTPKKDVQSTNIATPPPVTVAPGKIISLRPHKLKKRPVTVKKPDTTDDLIRKALERTKARVNKQREDRQIKSALSDLVKDLHTRPPPTETPAKPEATPKHSPTTTAQARNASDITNGQRTGPSTAAIDAAMRRYYMAISRRIHSYWSLPETQSWPPSLEAVVVIVVHRNGVIAKTFFEKKSANIYFNQYVEKTIQEAAPMPAFPSDIKEQQLEIGLKFKPSGML